MTGREVRARVVQGGGREDVLHIRLGGHLLKARLSGTPLPTGQDLFVRIESEKDGSFRLVLLGGKGSLTASTTTGPGAGPATPGPSQAVLRSYLAFLGAGPAASAPRSNREKGRGDLSRLSPADQKGFLRGIFQALAGGGSAGEINFQGEPVQYLLMDEWHEPQNASHGHSGRDDRPDPEQSESSDSDLVGWGRSEPAPACFCLRVRLPRLGTIGALISAPTPDFAEPSIYLTPLQPATLRLLQERLGEWRRLLAADLPGLMSLSLLPVEASPSGSVDFSA